MKFDEHMSPDLFTQAKISGAHAPKQIFFPLREGIGRLNLAKKLAPLRRNLEKAMAGVPAISETGDNYASRFVRTVKVNGQIFVGHNTSPNVPDFFKEFRAAADKLQNELDKYSVRSEDGLEWNVTVLAGDAGKINRDPNGDFRSHTTKLTVGLAIWRPNVIWNPAGPRHDDGKCRRFTASEA